MSCGKVPLTCLLVFSKKKCYSGLIRQVDFSLVDAHYKVKAHLSESSVQGLARWQAVSNNVADRLAKRAVKVCNTVPVDERVAEVEARLLLATGVFDLAVDVLRFWPRIPRTSFFPKARVSKPSFAHKWEGFGDKKRCGVCLLVCSARCCPPRLEKCSGTSALVDGIHGSHRLAVFPLLQSGVVTPSRLHVCTVCGAWAISRLRRLRLRCVGPSRVGSWWLREMSRGHLPTTTFQVLTPSGAIGVQSDGQIRLSALWQRIRLKSVAP